MNHVKDVLQAQTLDMITLHNHDPDKAKSIIIGFPIYDTPVQ